MSQSTHDSVFEEFKQFQLTDEDLTYLEETAKWARFLSIIGFISLGFLFLGGIAFATVLGSLMPQVPGSTISGPLIAGMYIGIAAIFLFPTINLYQFGTRTKRAIASADPLLLSQGLKAQKSLYKFLGIYSIIVLAIYGFIIFAAIVGGLFAGLAMS